MNMVPFDYDRFIRTLTAAIERGDVPMARIDDAVRRILRVKFMLGLFERPFADPLLLDQIGTADHRQVARQAVRESLVLLQNNEAALPIAKDSPLILVAGEAADDLGLQSGGWTIEWQGRPGNIIPGTTILQAIEATVSPNSQVLYNRFGRFDSLDSPAGIAIVVVAEQPYAEGMGDSNDLALSSADLATIERVREHSQKVVVIIVSGRPLIISDQLPLADAWLAAWLPGSEGQGVADVLFGDYPVTGKLPYTWPRAMSQLPFDFNNLGLGCDGPLFPYSYGLEFGENQPLTLLSMVAAALKSKEAALDQNTTIPIPKNPTLLSSAAVYGANASGKSNLLIAFALMRYFVLNSQNENIPNGQIKVTPFRLNVASKSQPSHFEVVFIENGKRYRYGFEVTTERVTAEWLYFVPSSREARLFERTGDEIIPGSSFKDWDARFKQYTRPNALFLSVVAQFNGPIAQKVVGWFREAGTVSGLDDSHYLLYTLNELLKGQHGQAIKGLITQLDVGIDDLQVTSQPFTFRNEIPKELRQALLILNKGEERLVLQTIHTIQGDDGPAGQEIFELTEDESEGTKKLVNLAGPLVDTLQKGKVLWVDELDARMHPLMTRQLISLFNNKQSNPHGAQLIFTTHDVNLLDNTLFRRDQIWFIEKDQQQASRLYSLAEFTVRNDKDYERGYIEGLFGAIPYLGNFVWSEKGIG